MVSRIALGPPTGNKEPPTTGSGYGLVTLQSTIAHFSQSQAVIVLSTIDNLDTLRV